MATPPPGAPPGLTFERRDGRDTRILFFHFLIAGLLLLLAGGLAHQQLRRTSEHANAERIQNQRRIVHPGPRGNILDRHQRVLVDNRPRFSVRLLLDAIRPEIRDEERVIQRNFRARDGGEQTDRKSTRLNSSHVSESRMPSSA